MAFLGPYWYGPASGQNWSTVKTILSNSASAKSQALDRSHARSAGSPLHRSPTTCRGRPFWKAETALGPGPRVPAYQQCTTLLVLGQSQKSSTSEPETQGDLLHYTVAFLKKTKLNMYRKTSFFPLEKDEKGLQREPNVATKRRTISVQTVSLPFHPFPSLLEPDFPTNHARWAFPLYQFAFYLRQSRRLISSS